MSIFGFEFTIPVLTLGAITGVTYGILAVGLVLVYRSNRIINFAHGEVGAFGAALLGVAVVEWGLSYWLAFVMAAVASASVGALAELLVVRRLRRAPIVMSIVATLGLAQVLLLFSLVINAQATAGRVYPQPAFLPSFDVGALRVTPAYFGMLFLTPLLVAGLAYFLRYSRFGLGIRAASANLEAARMAGVFAGRMSTLSWAIAGAVSAYTAILIRPTQGFVSAEALGPGLLLRALAAAVVARMTSLPVALGAGIFLGVAEQELLWNYPQGGLVEMVLFGVILVGLLVQHRHTGREEEKGSWAAVQPWAPLPETFRQVWTIRNLGRLAGLLALGLAILLAVVSTNAAAIILAVIMSFALVGLSIGVVTGLAGQLSLGQFALAGIGATASYFITRHTGNYLLGFAGAGAAAAFAAVLVGLPALRIRGLMLAVTTLSFSLAATAWLFQQPWMLGEGVDPGRPAIGSRVLDGSKEYYFFALAILVIGVWLARNIWRGGVGRRLRALRDNEDCARAFTVSATVGKLQGFALAGVLAGLGGAAYGHALSRIASTTFPISASISVVAMTVLGGIGIVAGPIIGALYIIGVPQFLPLDNAGLAATALGWLLIVILAPGGFAQLMRPGRDRIVAALARLAGMDLDALSAQAEAPAVLAESAKLARAARERAPGAAPAGGLLLEGSALRKYFGGVRAVDSVDLHVTAGETLGLIGPNGAGKTTLFEVLSGFTSADAGRVVFAGKDVTRLGPEARGRLGLIRSFQDASLFPTLTVLESVKLALERTAPTRLFPSVVGWSAPDRRKDERARDLVALMGLDRYRNNQIRELSTGTRRIAELTCLLALEPTMLLLDEPSSGIAQRETEVLAVLLRQVKEYLGVTLVIIEHDIPLVMGMSDRIIAMESGRIIASGTPEAVCNDPLVVESYLGGSVEAIASLEGASLDGRCREITRSGSRCSRKAVSDGLCAQHRGQLVEKQ